MKVLFLNNENRMNESIGMYFQELGHQVLVVGECDYAVLRYIEKSKMDLIVVNFEDIQKEHLFIFNEIAKKFGASCPIYFIKKNSSSSNDEENNFTLFKYELSIAIEF